jgi:single-stranded-DNA-specific exonuclease
LAGRGYGADRAQAEEIFACASSNPFMVPGLKDAAERLLLSIERGERVAIYADFDCDGMCAAALLAVFFERQGLVPLIHFPDRLRDGYGLNPRGVRNLAERGGQLLLALDLGANAQSEIDLAVDLGMDVVVVDHHLLDEPLARVAAAVNPLAGDLPDRFCAGVLAFKLAQAIGWLGNGSDNSDLVDLAAIATVADAMPLTGENRWLVSQGLEAIARAPRPGIEGLLKAARIGSAPSARDVAFRIAPLINSAGRIGDPALATRLLSSPDLAAARPLASELVSLGRRRREMSEQVEAILRPGLGVQGPVFSFDERFHPGVISATATRLCARRNTPVYLCAPAGDVVRGSGRTPNGHDAMAPLKLLSPAPLQLGGHPQACGFTIAPAQVEQLAQAISSYWAGSMDPWSPAPLGYDFSLAPQDLDPVLLESLLPLEPFGRGFAAPRCRLNEATVDRVFGFSGGRHLRIKLRDCQHADVVWFSGGVHRSAIGSGAIVDIIGEIARPRPGYAGIVVIVEDLRPA